MKIYEIKLTKGQLSSLPENERPLFFQLGHVFNELSFLNKLLYMVSDPELEGVERKGMTVQSMIVARIFIGKVFESWLMLERQLFNTNLMLELNSHLPDEAKEALNELKKYFGKNNLLSTIRNKFSFHYLSEHIEDVLNSTEDEKELSLILGVTGANTLHDYAEQIVSFGMLQKTSEESWQAAMDKIIGDLIRVSGLLKSFIGHLSASIFHLRLGQSWDDFNWVEHELNDLKNLEGFKIPFFFEENENESHNNTLQPTAKNAAS
jgi:hypothetical protein